ncbi:hypothetical protein DH2020_006455 [Rehmannia glutinosa]|uniref:Glutamate receptor n=1 Tax=Rehmannia glutinosa TaxID=99300 RepID=A0ABR0XJ24_REHGL
MESWTRGKRFQKIWRVFCDGGLYAMDGLLCSSRVSEAWRSARDFRASRINRRNICCSSWGNRSCPVYFLHFKKLSSVLYKNRYFVRTTLDDAVQAQALAAICQRFEWPEVVILYEDTEYGNHFISLLIKAFQDVSIGLEYMTSIPTSAEDSHILNELNKLNKMETRVFLVHMNPELGFRLFSIANTAGMMSEGYAWVITDSLSIFLDSIDSDTRVSMDGVLGVRPYVFASKNLSSFQERWTKNMLLNNSGPIMELNIYGLWAYDAVTALAIAVENIGPLNSSLLHANADKNRTHNTGLRISSFGPILLNELSSIKFRGLTGDFQLVDDKLKSSALEIFNLIGTGEKRVGFWTPERGIIRDVSASGEPTYSTLTKELKKITWPGDSVIQPKGWSIPTTGNLRVGVPWKPGFKEFVNVAIDPATNNTNATGFSVDIFLTALKVLPFPVNYEFHCYNDSTSGNWSYDDMLHKIPKEYDMVVADTTIWAPRASYVDFSLPYSESGVILVVKNKKPLDMWIFVKPLRWDLWLAIFVACILMGVVLRILERRVISTGGESVTPHAERPGTIYWSPIAILAFQERNMVSNSWSVFVLVCWLFMAFILMQSFTANLSAILTVDQLKFASAGDYYIGFHEGSFMRNFLTDQLGFRESRLRPYASMKAFHDAMSKGSKKGGIDAIFDEIPYMKLFLNRYETQYKMVGPTYRTDGLGFAFPIGSPLVAHFSRAILNVTQGPEMNYIEQKNFGPGYSSQDPLSSVISQGSSSLTLHEFAGLFILTGLFTLFALVCSETAIGRKLTDITGHFMHNCFSFSSPQVHSMEGASVDGDTINGAEDRSDGFTQDNANAPPSGEGGDDQLIREPNRHDDEEIDETDLNNGTSAAQDARVRIEDHGLRSP